MLTNREKPELDCGCATTVASRDVTPALAGFLAGLSLIVAIGAQNAFVLRQGLRREHVLPVVAVCAGADGLLVTAGIAGLGQLVAANPVLLAVARYGGAAFLAVYGVRAALRARHPETLAPAPDDAGTRRAAVTTALALTFLNPHVYLDTVVLLGTIAQRYGDARALFGVGAVVASITWFTALGLGASRLSGLFARPRAWQVLDLLVAAVMLTLAVVLVL